MAVCRFAPSATGPAHPGTLLAALLCWLDARRRGARLLLRLEDLDPQRCRPGGAEELAAQLAWFGLDFDAVERQSDHTDRHRAALDRLVAAGLVYACACSRSTSRDWPLAADGGRIYPGTCRAAGLPLSGDRSLRLRLPPGKVAPRHEGGDDPRQDPTRSMGDPVIWSRVGTAAYHLANVADDIAAGVDRVVRGRDLLPSCAIQHILWGLLGAVAPVYRHHLLLLEDRGGGKLSKFHGAVGVPALRAVYDAPALGGILAQAAGLRPTAEPVTPGELLVDFTWDRVRTDDVVLAWDGERLTLPDDRPADRPSPSRGRYVWTTAPGPAAIALVETPAWPDLLDRPLPEPGRVCHARLVDSAGGELDEVVATRLAEDRLELATHAGPGIRAAIEEGLRRHGLVPAAPPADDRWGRLSRAAHPAALAALLRHPIGDPGFPERWLSELPVVLITGPPNAGKSTLLNAWCGYRRALVDDLPGTTRDLLVAVAEHRGWRLRLVDGAGLRAGGDELERAGMDLVRAMRQRADVVVRLDPAPAPTAPAGPGEIVVRAKADLGDAGHRLPWSAPEFAGAAASAAMLTAIGDEVLAMLGLPPGG
jgi:hypothetical protein